MVHGRSRAKQRHLCQDVPLGPVLWERISCQSVKNSVLADGDLWEVVVCAGHRRSRWLWTSLKHSIPKQIHKYSGYSKDCRSMNVPLRANVGMRGPIFSFYLLIILAGHETWWCYNLWGCAVYRIRKESEFHNCLVCTGKWRRNCSRTLALILPWLLGN